MIQVIAARHFIDKGLPVNGAVAMTCVLYFESKLNPGSQGVQPTEHGGVINRQGAVGIASWNGPVDQSKVGDPAHDRQAALAAYAQKHGLVWSALETQLDFVVNEIANSYPRSWAMIRDPMRTYDDIISVLVAEYENPADHAREIAGAREFAGPLLDAVKDYKPAPAPSSPPSTPPKPGTPTMPIDPVLLEQLLKPFAPLFEALISGMIKGLVNHLAPGGAAPAGFDPMALGKVIAEELQKLGAPK